MRSQSIDPHCCNVDGTYDCPKYTLEFVNDVQIITFKSMHPNKLSEVRKMTFFLKYLTSELCLGEFAIKM